MIAGLVIILFLFALTGAIIVFVHFNMFAVESSVQHLNAQTNGWMTIRMNGRNVRTNNPDIKIHRGNNMLEFLTSVLRFPLFSHFPAQEEYFAFFLFRKNWEFCCSCIWF